VNWSSALGAAGVAEFYMPTNGLTTCALCGGTGKVLPIVTNTVSVSEEVKTLSEAIIRLNRTITQLQNDNRRLVDERRAADIHYRDIKVVYVAHPLSGPDRDANIARASRWCAWAFKSGYAPVADWIVLASQLDESYREQGLRADCALIKRCDEVWLCGGRVSEGMRIEAAAARLVGVPVKDMTALGEEPPEWPHPGTDFVSLRRTE